MRHCALDFTDFGIFASIPGAIAPPRNRPGGWLPGCPGSWACPHSKLVPFGNKKHQEHERRRQILQFPACKTQHRKYSLFNWLPLAPMWIQYLKFSRPHDQYSARSTYDGQTKWEREREGKRWTFTVRHVADSILPRSARDHTLPPSVRDQRHLHCM